MLFGIEKNNCNSDLEQEEKELLKKIHSKLSKVVHICNPSTLEIEAGEFQG